LAWLGLAWLGLAMLLPRMNGTGRISYKVRTPWAQENYIRG
jgi:hypothetical protein